MRDSALTVSTRNATQSTTVWGCAKAALFPSIPMSRYDQGTIDRSGGAAEGEDRGHSLPTLASPATPEKRSRQAGSAGTGARDHKFISKKLGNLSGIGQTSGIYEPLVIRVALSVRGAWRERCVQCDQIAHSWSSMPSARLLDIAASVRTHLMPTRTPLTLRCAPTASATRRCPKNKPAEPWPVSSAENYRRILKTLRRVRGG